MAELPFILHFTANVMETSLFFEPFYITHSSIPMSDVYLSSFLLGQPSMELLATKSQALVPVLSFLIYQLWLTACTSSLVLPNTACSPSKCLSDYFPLHCTLWNGNIPFLLHRCHRISLFPNFYRFPACRQKRMFSTAILFLLFTYRYHLCNLAMQFQWSFRKRIGSKKEHFNLAFSLRMLDKVAVPL